MPIVKISCFDHWSEIDRYDISQIIHEALLESFKIPQSDFNHRFELFSENQWQIPDTKTTKYILIEMTIFPGRSKEAKAKLFKSITDKLFIKGIKGNDCTIILYEPPLENWGMNGLRGDQDDIGFNLNI